MMNNNYAIANYFLPVSIFCGYDGSAVSMWVINNSLIQLTIVNNCADR